jgi:hypothetical protein
MRSIGRVLVGAVLTMLLVLVPARVAVAACHAFQVKVAPASVTEGAAVTVTVSRDGAVGPSNIDVATVDDTARAPDDYTAVSRTISFTNETSQTFTVETKNDTTPEPSETFRLHLSKPGGCTVNPNFVVGPDAQVTIQDDDAAPTTGAPPSATTAAPSSSSPRSSAAPATTKAPATTAPPTSATVGNDAAASTTAASVPSSSTSSALAAAGYAAKEGGGMGVAVPVAIAAVVLAIGAGGFWAFRRRSDRPA